MLSFLLLMHSARLAYSAGGLRPFRFVEIKRTKEAAALPPTLKVTFDLMCNEKFVKLIRYDKTDPKTGQAIIAVGALVEEDLFSSCAGQNKEMEVSAGKTFSGRQFSISLIKK